MKQELYFLFSAFRLGAPVTKTTHQTGSLQLVHPLALSTWQWVGAVQTHRKQSIKWGWELGAFPAGGGLQRCNA